MKAMILAAGRGDRMRPLTDATPKPLLLANGKPLIQYNIEKLVDAGFTDIVINVAYLGSQIISVLGDGQQFGANIVYSDEGDRRLETAGGIIKALPLLGEQPFLVINSDISCDFPLIKLKQQSLKLAHLILVKNPQYHLEGDFSLTTDGQLSTSAYNRYTFSGIGVYNPKLFAGNTGGKLKLGPILKAAADKGLKLCYHHHMGTVVQSSADIDALMNETGDEVYLLLDSGHAVFSGADPVELAKKYAGRIGHVHCKDIRESIMQRCLNRDSSFLDAVLDGVFTVPGDGCIDYAGVFSALDINGYSGWAVVEAEQDPNVADPLVYATMGFNNLAKLVRDWS